MFNFVIAELFFQSLVSNTESVSELVRGIKTAGGLVLCYYLKKTVSELFVRHFKFGLANKNKE